MFCNMPEGSLSFEGQIKFDNLILRKSNSFKCCEVNIQNVINNFINLLNTLTIMVLRDLT